MTPERIEELAYACGPEPRYVNAVRWAVQTGIREALEEAAGRCLAIRLDDGDECYRDGCDDCADRCRDLAVELTPAAAPPHP
jgi:hypothetical protein